MHHLRLVLDRSGLERLRQCEGDQTGDQQEVWSRDREFQHQHQPVGGGLHLQETQVPGQQEHLTDGDTCLPGDLARLPLWLLPGLLQ